jgi:hypothetical protein
MSLLDDRVKEFSIPAWPGEAVYDRIIVFRVPDQSADRDTFVKGGLLVKPDDKKEQLKFRSPRGVVVSAGLKARDILESNGIGLGHLIWMASHSPFRFEVDVTEQGSVEFFFMNAGDIILSEDLLEQRVKGLVSIEKRDGMNQLSIDGDALPRFDPPTFADTI